MIDWDAVLLRGLLVLGLLLGLAMTAMAFAMAFDVWKEVLR